MVRNLFSALLALALTASTAMSIELRPIGGSSTGSKPAPITKTGTGTISKLPVSAADRL